MNFNEYFSNLKGKVFEFEMKILRIAIENVRISVVILRISTENVRIPNRILESIYILRISIEILPITTENSVERSYKNPSLSILWQ